MAFTGCRLRAAVRRSETVGPLIVNLVLTGAAFRDDVDVAEEALDSVVVLHFWPLKYETFIQPILNRN